MKILYIVENGLQESLGIASLVSAVARSGHKSDMILFSHTPDVYSYIRETKPDIIGFSIVTGAHRFAYKLGREIRDALQLPTIAGGPHSTFYPEHMADSGAFDYICRGEGEQPLTKLLDNLSSGADATNISSLWALVDGIWHKNEIGNLTVDLDELPIPDRSVFYKYKFLKDMSLKRFVTGIGCPYPCSFCHSPIYKREMKGKGKFVRHKSPEYIVREIEQVQSIARLDRIHFSDDTFGHDINWLEDFAPVYKKKIGLPFSCNARADTPLKVIELLGQAGCTGVQIGLESGSQRVRKELLKKTWTDEQAIETCHAFRKSRIRIMVTNMIGLPSETLEEALSTIDLNAKCKVDFARANVFLAHPALDLTKWAIENGYIKKDYSLDDFVYDALNPVIKSKFQNEFINIANLFSLAVKHKSLLQIINKGIHLKPNKFYDFLGSLNLFQEYFFFDLKPISAWNYFRNTLKTPIGLKYGAWPTDRLKSRDNEK